MVTIQRINILSRLRRVIEFTRFARKEILQIYTNQTNIILKIIERFEKILIDSCPLKMPKAWKNTGRSLTTDYSDFTDYFNKTSHWRAWLNDFSDLILIRLIRLIIVF